MPRQTERGVQRLLYPLFHCDRIESRFSLLFTGRFVLRFAAAILLSGYKLSLGRDLARWWHLGTEHFHFKW